MMQPCQERQGDPGEEETQVGKKRWLMEYSLEQIPQFHSGMEVSEVVEQLLTILEMAKKENRQLKKNMCVVDGELERIHSHKIENRQEGDLTSKMLTYCREAAGMHHWRSLGLEAAAQKRFQFVNRKIRKLRLNHAATTAALREKVELLKEAKQAFEAIVATPEAQQTFEAAVCKSSSERERP